MAQIFKSYRNLLREFAQKLAQRCNVTKKEMTAKFGGHLSIDKAVADFNFARRADRFASNSQCRQPRCKQS
jgi:hypothetical protein